jgi:K+-sensing histidine kinase KdpD
MAILKGIIPFAAALAIVSLVTAILFYFKLATLAPDHPVFFYLLPVALVTMLFRSLTAALFGVFAAAACADYFLYEPIYSFSITTRVEFGDLSCFALVALIGVKCTSELFPSAAKMRPTSRYR